MARPPSALDLAARAAALRLGRAITLGTIVVRDWGGQHRLGSGEPAVAVTVRDPRTYAALCRGSIGLGDTYARGWWDCDELTDLVRVLDRNLSGPRRLLDRVVASAAPILDAPSRLRRPDKARDRANVRAHYDVGNDFFSVILDPTMTYSCALFERPAMSLEDAQVAKLDRICRTLALSENDHVVEIGTGWGSFAVHAASRYGCRVTTTTVSAAQHDHARKRVADAALTDRVTVLDADYRDLTGTYDKLASIEMIEAVDWRDHDAFFARCASLLRPDGLAAVQAIVIADESFERAKHHDDFIRRSIFPGGCLPSVTSIARSASGAGLRLVGLRDVGRHYAETLRRWRSNLQAHEDAVDAMGLGREFRRRWHFYLAYCEAAFLERHISDVQLLLAMPGWRDPLPATA
ncbi:MAG TPA: cyclopropane-fatty-acyl-phospholipid synthase family protein [Acidimicrobiales bacterium]|nr:cyclopropane-fatty-acyl-phospholipid synthase family protein [Acidimicrobiales bacterium]